MKFKVSVVVPIYNVEKYIAQCLESLSAQTLHDVEIVLVDDCGTDKSVSIAERYAAADARMKIVRREKNGGLSAARNTGIENSSAPFVMFCDSDDFVEPKFCEMLLAAIESSNADMAMCGTSQVLENGKKKRTSSYFRINAEGSQSITESVVRRTNPCVWNKIYRRDILQTHAIWFPEGLYSEDEYFWRVYCLHAKTIAFIPGELYNYRIRSNSIMSNISRKKSVHSADVLKIAIEYYDYLKKNNFLGEYRGYALEMFINFAQAALDRTDTKRHGDIYDMARDFIKREGLSSEDFPPELKRAFVMLQSGLLSGVARRLFFGLVKIEEKAYKKKIYFAGIPVWKTQYDKEKKTGRLFGLFPVYTLRGKCDNAVRSVCE